MPKKITTEEFIIKAKKVHDIDWYIYSKTIYINARIPIIIICPDHGEFTPTPDNFINKKSGCPKCGHIKTSKKQTSNSLTFILKAQEVHVRDWYDYSKTIYTNAKIPIIIICPLHGEFYQTPDQHINRKSGCSKCSGTYIQSKDEFIIKAREVHGYWYGYSLVDYKTNNLDKVIITCPLHGEFLQLPYTHVNQKCGCPKCSGTYNPTTEEFIIKAKKVHGSDWYVYSKTIYVNAKTPIIIICPDHGEFTLTPDLHINRCIGCSKCNLYGASKISFDWLSYQELSSIIEHKKNNREYTIPSTKYRADGFCKETNTIYEFNGDYWHGNPKLYNSSLVNPTSRKTFGELYENTIKKKEKCIELGYKYIEIWESQWRLAIKLVKIIQRNFRKKGKKKKL